MTNNSLAAHREQSSFPSLVSLALARIEPQKITDIIRGITEAPQSLVENIRERCQRPVLDLINAHTNALLEKIGTDSDSMLVMPQKYALNARQGVERAFSNQTDVQCPAFFVQPVEKQDGTIRFEVIQFITDGEYTFIKVQPENLSNKVDDHEHQMLNTKTKRHYIMDNKITSVGALGVRWESTCRPRDQDRKNNSGLAVFGLEQSKVLNNGRRVCDKVSAGGGLLKKDIINTSSDSFNNLILSLGNGAIREFCEEMFGLSAEENATQSPEENIELLRAKTKAFKINVFICGARKEDKITSFSPKPFDCLTDTNIDVIIELKGGKKSDVLAQELKSNPADKRGQPGLFHAGTLLKDAERSRSKPVVQTAAVVRGFLNREKESIPIFDYKGK